MNDDTVVISRTDKKNHVLVMTLKRIVSSVKVLVLLIISSINKHFLENGISFPKVSHTNLRRKSLQRVKSPYRESKVHLNTRSKPFSINRYFKDVRANCFFASLLRTQIHMPRHASSTRAKY